MSLSPWQCSYGHAAEQLETRRRRDADWSSMRLHLTKEKRKLGDLARLSFTQRLLTAF